MTVEARAMTTRVPQGRAFADLGGESGALPMPRVDGVTHRWITVGDGCRIHVAEAGAGSPLILVHGWPQHWFAWRTVIRALAERFRLILPDVRGLGWSDAEGRDWSLTRLATDVVHVMDAVGVERAGVVGHDWGAAIAYRLGMDHRHRVTRLMPLAALHPWAATGVHPRTLWRPWHVYTGAVSGAANNTWMQVPRIALRSWRSVGTFNPAETEIYCGSMRQPHTQYATTRYYRNLLTREVPHFWRHGHDIDVTLPVLHVNGADDPLTRRLSAAYRDHAPGMSLVELPECGHFIAEERPAELVEHIAGFFDADH